MKNINSQKGGALVWIIILIVIIGAYVLFTGKDEAAAPVTETATTETTETATTVTSETTVIPGGTETTTVTETTVTQ